MHRPTAGEIGNVDWQARARGYEMSDRPTMVDADAILAQFTATKWTQFHREDILRTLEYAYLLRCKHRTGNWPQGS